MAKDTLYNISFTSPTQVTREEYTNVGSGDLILGNVKRGFKGGTDFEIWDAASGGTQLVEDTDYELIDQDIDYTNEAGFTVYTGYKIINATYQTGSIYATYKIIGSYTDTDFINTLRSDVDQNTSDIATNTANIGAGLPTDFAGLRISNDTDTDHDINVTAGRCCDSTRAYILTLSSELTKQIDATWAAGDDAGGLDTGTVAADTWYYIYAIRKDSDASVDVLISASASSPTLPSGYTYYRRLRGAVLTDSSANILGFYQKDKYFWFKTKIQDVNSSTSPTSRLTVTVSVPPDMVGLIGATFRESAERWFTIGNTDETDTAPSSTYFDTLTLTGVTATTIKKHILVNSSSQIYYRGSGSVSTTYIHTDGFIDNAEL